MSETATWDPNLRFEGSIVLSKMANQNGHLPWSEFVTLQGCLDVFFEQACVRCLSSVPAQLSFDLACYFIPETFKHHKDWENETSIVYREQEYDLHFLQKNTLEFKEMIDEYIELEAVDLPICNENCAGLCSECGENLNVQSCKHAKGPNA